MHKLVTLIVAAGSGSRMAKELPKQFLLLDGKPIVMQTIWNYQRAIEQLQNVDKFVHEMLILLPEGYLEMWGEWCREYNFQVPHRVAAGGKTRFQSVRNGLETITEDTDYILVHDGVRPFVSAEMMLRIWEGVKLYGAVIPVVPLVDSLRKIEAGDADGEILSKPVDREKFRAVQTPQAFRGEWLRKAYQTEEQPGFTDEATTVEQVLDKKIVLVDGEQENFKITTSQDLKRAEAYFKN